MDTKVCCRCKRNLPATSEYFSKDSRKKDGFFCSCKECRKKEYLDNRLVKDFSKTKEGRRVRAELISTGYCRCNKCLLIKSISEFYMIQERVSPYCKDCAKLNNWFNRIMREDGGWIGLNKLGRTKRHCYDSEELKHENKLYWNSIRNKRYKKRSKEDLTYVFIKNLRGGMNRAIKNSGAINGCNFNEYLGCTPSFFKEYISSLFDDWMTFGNYGKWHLDHIRPCASFDLTDIEQQKECFHYTNIRPLEAKQNIVKGAWYDGVDYRNKKYNK